MVSCTAARRRTKLPTLAYLRRRERQYHWMVAVKGTLHSDCNDGEQLGHFVTDGFSCSSLSAIHRREHVHQYAHARHDKGIPRRLAEEQWRKLITMIWRTPTGACMCWSRYSNPPRPCTTANSRNGIFIGRVRGGQCDAVSMTAATT